jgi:hypothetical protein
MQGQRISISNRDKQIVCGLFLSKYDQAALDYLGFQSFIEAFNALGFSLGARPASIKNYRDEIDPFFPNRRRGWHKRPLRAHCKRIMDTYSQFDIATLGDLIKSFLCPELELDSIPDVARVLQKLNEAAEFSFARRLITGKAAEEYFRINYLQMPEFRECRLTDTTQWGCGFDFKLTVTDNISFSAVEVKGLRNRYGQVQMTDLEHAIAEALADRYYLVLVRNFAESPFHSVIRDPVHGDLEFSKVERKEVRISWLANIKE